VGQHTIPQQYQRNFQDPNRPGFIWFHDKKDGPPARCVPIKAALQSKEFYPPETEKQLAEEIEKPGNNAIAKLVNDRAIDEDERLSVSRYAGTMLLRVPAFRRWVDALVPDAMSEVIARGRQIVQTAEADGRWDPELIARRYQEFDAIERRYSAQTPQWAFETAYNPFPSEIIVGTLFSMTWRIIKTSGPQFFLTTDDPAFFFFRQGMGLGNPRCQFALPLSTTHALHGSWHPAPRDPIWVNVRQASVREVNKWLISQTGRVALYHRPASWIFALFANPDLNLNLLGW